MLKYKKIINFYHFETKPRFTHLYYMLGTNLGSLLFEWKMLKSRARHRETIYFGICNNESFFKKNRVPMPLGAAQSQSSSVQVIQALTILMLCQNVTAKNMYQKSIVWIMPLL